MEKIIDMEKLNRALFLFDEQRGIASVNRGGYHAGDLKHLSPTEDELVSAAKWCLTQDVSPEFKAIPKDMFIKLGWPDVSARI